MTNPAPEYFCANHPGLPVQWACTDCGRPFCESCLTEMAGQVLCGWCRDLRLGRIQQRSTVNPVTIVLLARVFNGASLAFGLVYAAIYVGAMSLSLFAGTKGGSSDDSTAFGIIVAMVVVGTVLAFVAYLPPMIGLRPGRGWLWSWQFAAFIFSILGGCLSGGMGLSLWVPAVILLVYWVKPEVREYCV